MMIDSLDHSTFQPYYVAFANAMELTPEECVQKIETRAFVKWIQDQWERWEKWNGKLRTDFDSPSLFRIHLAKRYGKPIAKGAE